MKLHLIDRRSKQNKSFTARKNSFPYFLKMWHYHPELELILVLKSTGTKFIGDSIGKFEEGDVLLIGKNLPHMLFNDEEYFNESSGLIAEAIAIHFKKEFLGDLFLNTPEMNHISKLFEKAIQGIHFMGIASDLKKDIEGIVSLTDGYEKTIKFLNILNVLANQRNYKLLSSKGFAHTFNHKENKKLDKIYSYIFKNFNEPIRLETVANIANMNPSAFSRFFKRIHRKTFSKYLNEIRIGYACKLLIENKYNITRICFESGYNNVSNFNRQFKFITNMSPSMYLRYHNKNNQNLD